MQNNSKSGCARSVRHTLVVDQFGKNRVAQAPSPVRLKLVTAGGGCATWVSQMKLTRLPLARHSLAVIPVPGTG